MAEAFDLSYPYDGQDAFEDQWRDMFRAMGSGVIAGGSNELAPFADSSGRQVKVSTGGIWAGGQFGQVTAEKTLAVATNGSGQPRIDRVVVRNVFGTGIELDVLTGSPGASPSPPALTSDSSMQEFSLAQVGPLGSGFTTVTAGQIFDERYFISLNGPPAYATAGVDLTLWTPLAAGMTFVGRDTGGIYMYDGAGYVHLRREHPGLLFTPAGNDDASGGGFAQWPTGLGVSVTVPGWATRAFCRAKIGQVRGVTADLNHTVALTFGAVTVDSAHIEWSPVDPKQDINLAGFFNVTGYAGTSQTFQVTAARGGGTGALRADALSSCCIDVEFS